MWSKLFNYSGFTSLIDRLYAHNNYGVIVALGGLSVLVLAIGVATFIRGFLFQGPYNGFTIWGCSAFKMEYKYFRVAADIATGILAITILFICIPKSDFKNLIGIPTISPLFFGFLVEWVLKFYDKTIGKYAKISL